MFAFIRTLLTVVSLTFLPALAAPGLVLSQTQVPSNTPTQAPGTDVELNVSDTKLVLTGCASPNAFVRIFKGNNLVGTVTAGASGRFSKQIIVNNASAGLHKFRIYYEDANNRISSVVDKTISLSAQSDTNMDLLLPTTIEHEPEPVVAGDYLIFRGSSCPGALVNVNLDNNLVLAAKADSKGNWYVIADTEDYYKGSHVYEALSSLDGKISTKTHKYQFSVTGEGEAPGQPPTDLPAPVITEPQDLFLSSTNTVTIRGTGPLNSQIELFVDSNLVGSVFTNASGEWSFTLDLQTELSTVTARACYKKSCGDFSNSIRIRHGGDTTSCTTGFRLKDYRFYGVKQNQGIDLEITDFEHEEPLDALIDWGDATVGHLTLDDSRQKKFHHVYGNYGQYNGSVTLSQTDGACSTTVYFSVLVTPDYPPNWWMLGIIPLAGAMIYLISSLVNAYQNEEHWIPHSKPDGGRPEGWPTSRPWLKPTFGADDEHPRDESGSDNP